MDPQARPTVTVAPSASWKARIAILCGLWAGVVVLDLLHLVWIAPLVIWLGAASLVRSQASLTDRLMVASAAMVGFVCIMGAAWSVWPWRLDPVPVAISLFTCLWLVTQLTGRQPQLPRPSRHDAVFAGATGILGWWIGQPYLTEPSLAGRLALAMPGEDNGRHYALFDIIGNIGGLPAVAQSRALEQTFSALIQYPQGWHFNAAVLDGFLRQHAGRSGGLAGLDHYFAATVMTFVLLCVTVMWAASRLAGKTSILQFLVVIVVAGSFTLGTELVRLLMAGYPGECLGLTLIVVLLVVLTGSRTGTSRAGDPESLVVVGLLLIGLGMTYYLLLFPAGLVVLGWLWMHRVTILKHRVILILVALATAVLAPATGVWGLLAGDQASQLDTGGDGKPIRNALLILGPAFLIGLLVQGRRPGVGERFYLGMAVSAAVFAVPVGFSTLKRGDGFGYYGDKVLHVVLVCLIIAVASFAGRLPIRVPGRLRPMRNWISPLVTTGLACTMAVSATGLVGPSGGLFHEREGALGLTWWQAWQSKGFRTDRPADVVVGLMRDCRPRRGATPFIVDDAPLHSLKETIFMTAIDGTTKLTAHGLYQGAPLEEPGRLTALLAQAQGPVDVLAASDASALYAKGIIDVSPRPDLVELRTCPVPPPD